MAVAHAIEGETESQKRRVAVRVTASYLLLRCLSESPRVFCKPDPHHFLFPTPSLPVWVKCCLLPSPPSFLLFPPRMGHSFPGVSFHMRAQQTLTARHFSSSLSSVPGASTVLQRASPAVVLATQPAPPSRGLPVASPAGSQPLLAAQAQHP